MSYFNAVTGITHDWAPINIADRWYEVTAARSYDREIEVGGLDDWGNKILRIMFYTGFAGCPARYHVTVENTPRPGVVDFGPSTTIQNATGAHGR